MHQIENKTESAAPQEAGAIVDIGIADPAALHFSISVHGYLQMERSGETYKRVQLSRILPFSEPFQYIAVSDMDGNELCILRDVAALAPEEGALVRDALARRYFCPTITKIKSIREKMGYFYFDTEIGTHEKLFAVKDITRSIKSLDEKCILITDIDGNRYTIADVWAIDPKSRRKIEPYLY